MSVIIAPSVLSADFANLQRDAEMINQSEADWFHVDIMDGLFVPNISFGFPVVKALKKHAKKPLDVHLMIVDPDRYLNDFKAVEITINNFSKEILNNEIVTNFRDIDKGFDDDKDDIGVDVVVVVMVVVVVVMMMPCVCGWLISR